MNCGRGWAEKRSFDADVAGTQDEILWCTVLPVDVTPCLEFWCHSAVIDVEKPDFFMNVRRDTYFVHVLCLDWAAKLRMCALESTVKQWLPLQACSPSDPPRAPPHQAGALSSQPTPSQSVAVPTAMVCGVWHLHWSAQRIDQPFLALQRIILKCNK